MAINIAQSSGLKSIATISTLQSAPQLVRTSTGVIYAVFVMGGRVSVFKSSGSSWSMVSNTNSPLASGSSIVSCAIDANNVIHIAFPAIGELTGTRLGYIQFATSTDTFGVTEIINGVSVPNRLSISVDSNSNPHIAAIDNGNVVSYSNRVNGYWRAQSVTIASVGGQSISIRIDNNNVPQISFIDTTNTRITLALGNKNNASSFNTQNVVLSGSFTANTCSIIVTPNGDTWIAYQAFAAGPVMLQKHKQTDAWSTWQTAITNNNPGKGVSLALDGNQIYVFYEKKDGAIAYDRYDTKTLAWLGEQIVQANTSPMTTNKQWHNPSVKWSYYFNNGETGDNNKDQNTIEYLFDDGTTAYYDKLVTAQISTGLASISFSPSAPATTTSTSSTSQSTSTSLSTSTSSTSSSTSTSISTSISSTSQSTSTSVSTSTSSTSSSTSLSTSSTSQSTSISTSSTSASTSLSTSSTSQSTSTSITTSTSSTSQSTSTSASTSTSSTSQSTSTSLSTSTSSTSQSTSTSVSSTSSSISTSTSSTSQSISTSQSTSTSSTSQSTSTSISTSTSSTSSSISTSTSSTSQSTSISTSSTSSSISTSTSSTSQSTSTSKSTSTSSTSQSTSTSLSTSTSSTSASTSLSTSSTSSSTSLSTSSTSQSTSVSTSTSSTSQSTSTTTTVPAFTTSTSSTSSSTSTTLSTSSTSQSTSTSISISTSSTSQSTSISQSTSTSLSTSSTSQSTSTTTVAGVDYGMIPRVTIRDNSHRFKIENTDPRIRQIRLRLR